MSIYNSKDGNVRLPEEQKFYLIRNGVIDRKFKGNAEQAERQRKSYEAKGEKVDLILVEEADS